SSRVSNIAMVSEGSSSFRKTPSVELIMPAPMSTTSGSALNVSGIGFLFQINGWLLASSRMTRSSRGPLQLASAKRYRGSWLKDHVGTTPGGIVGQFPTVPGSDRIFSKQDIAGVEKEMLALASLEIQRAAQGDDELANRCGVPGESAARCRLLEGDRGNGE